MDLLASLNIDELPEQQTRVKDLVEKHPDFDMRLGFDACCTCGNQMAQTDVVMCPNCRRVSYCSESCRQQDATALPYSEDEDAEQALGHAAVICSLLKLCQDDEDVQENYNVDKMDSQARRDALDRLQSERESYPATLVNVLAEGPAYQSVWSRILERQGDDNRKVAIHVIGASHEAELWDATKDEEMERVVAAYADACSDLMESKQLQAVQILMVGPECAHPTNPTMRWKKTRPVKHTFDRSSVTGDLILETRPTVYDSKVIAEDGAPDVVVFFNPGFTVPDYEWRDSLATIPRGIPFLLATNTEVEGIADAQFLLDQDKVQSIPPGLQDIFGLYSEKDDEYDDAEETTLSFFSVNPFCGNRVRQSGTMANDLFVRNRWMLGGILDSYNPSKEHEGRGSKKPRTVAESNRKATNPALI